MHNPRHTASSIMMSEALRKEVGLADMMEILGHNQVETTIKYIHSELKGISFVVVLPLTSILS